MAIRLTTCILFFCLNGFSQNWNVFNKSYRYNYKFDNSTVVSQVLFADSVKQAGNDTVYYMNRIGYECTSNCPPSLFPAGSPTYGLIPNVPQFLQRTIIKFSNGLVMLRDTARLVLRPRCTPGQSWLFDSLSNKSALCLSVVQRQVFGVSDSVKNILVAGTDTLKLSKQFGILQFPKLYAQNKYYRLVGIEKAATYDSVAFYGDRVPNAWDFYNFNLGDKFCYSHFRYEKSFNINNEISCFNGDVRIVSKTLTPTGYTYETADFYKMCGGTYYAPFVNSVYQNLTDKKRIENFLYPGQLISFNPYGFNYYNLTLGLVNIARYGMDSKGTFYKFVGYGCLMDTAVSIFPFNPVNKNPFDLTYNYGSVIFATGLGKISSVASYNPQTDYTNDCLTCAVKSGQLYFGTETFVGLNEASLLNENLPLIYPNPGKGAFEVRFSENKTDELIITDLLGRRVMNIGRNNGEALLPIDLSEQAPGIYFVYFHQKGQLLGTRKLVKE